MTPKYGGIRASVMIWKAQKATRVIPVLDVMVAPISEARLRPRKTSGRIQWTIVSRNDMAIPDVLPAASQKSRSQAES